MDKDKRNAFLETMRKLSKKGFYGTLEYVSCNEPLHYADILKFALEKHIVESRATVTLIVRGLLKMDLIERTVLDSRPVRTVYRVTQKGSKVLELMQQIEGVLET
jgi:DNA-binding HxlR family transcriptional regulator